jgi:hypothetical protein
VEIVVYADQNLFLAVLKNANLKAYNEVKPSVQSNPMDNPVNASLNTVGFILRKQSVLVGRSRGVIISCAGYLDLPESGMRIVRMSKHTPWDLHRLFNAAGRWKKGEASVSAVYFKDSAVSGFVAKRAVQNNSYSSSEMNNAAEDAEWRASNNASANPALINGPADTWQDTILENGVARPRRMIAF